MTPWERKPCMVPEKKEHLQCVGSLPCENAEDEKQHELTESTSDSSIETAEVKNEEQHKGRDSSPKTIMISAVGKFTIPKPFYLATEKRASHRALNSRVNISGKHENCDQADYKKLDKEGAACSRTISNTKSSPPPSSTPVFHCEERARNREKFLIKLEAKHRSLEAEKSKRESMSKEEKEAEIKQLRRSLTFKATPMPNFYRAAKKEKAGVLIGISDDARSGDGLVMLLNT